MTASRIRVRPPHSHWGLVAFAALLGATMAAAVAAYVWFWYLWPYWPWLPRYNVWIVNSSQAAIAGVPFLLFLIWLPRQCQHARWAAVIGATYALSITLFTMLGVDLYQPYAAFHAIGSYLLLLPIAPAIGAALALGAMHAQQTFYCRLIEQDGTLCNHCGYPAARSGSATCPECGGECEPLTPARSERVTAYFGRHRTFTLASLLVALGLGYGLVLWAERDHRTLGRTFGEEWTTTPYQFTPLAGLSTAAYRASDEDDGVENDGVVFITLTHKPAWRARELHVGLGHLYEVRPGRLVISPGSVMVYAQVPNDRIRDMLRNGPPQAMIDQLNAKAREVGWEATDGWWNPAETIEMSWEE